MAGPLVAAGAVQEPSEYATLSMDRAITGLWTQRSPLRDADVPYLYGKFYSASRFDSLIDGINREITAKLTIARRPGSSVWNSNTFPAINSFYSFKYIQNNAQVIRVLADGRDGNIYDATGGGKTTLFTKSAGAGKTRFLGVGPELFFTDGVDMKKWVRSSLVWAATTSFAENAFIVDTNNNLQLSIGAQTATISNIQIQSNVCTLFFTAATAITIPVGTKLALAGLTGITALNSTTQTITTVTSGQQVSFAFVHANVAYSTETGSATTGTGISGSGPTWQTGLGAITQDGTLQWECRGTSVQNWMSARPAAAPTVTQANAPSIYPSWAASTWYAPLFVILDSNGNLQQLTTAGTTAGSPPTWATSVGVTTTDGTAVWTCMGASAWAAVTAYAVGAVVQAVFTYWTTQTEWGVVGYDPYNGPEYGWISTQVQVSATGLFQCVTAGTSGSSTPGWTNGVNTQLNDGTVQWKNMGTANSRPGNTQALSLATSIIDTNNNIQAVQQMAETGSSAPTWATGQGSYTVDNTELWLNQGPYGKANTGAWIWCYAGWNSITKDSTTASPQSLPLTVSAGKQPVLQGTGLADTQFDSIRLYRTAQGQSSMIYLDTIPNPGAGQTWVYTDTTPDTRLTAQIPAPIADSNDPPPAGMTAPIFHAGRVFAISGTTVIWSGGPDTLTGSGNTAWPPLNFASIPEQPIRLFTGVTNQGTTLFVFGTTNIYAIFGNGTSSDPFTAAVMYMPGVGIASYDAVDVIGSTYYALTGKSKFISLDPSAGYTEVGFPIGDQLKNVTTGAGSAATGALYSPTSSYVTWYEGSSGDTALYVSDGSVGWFRFSPVASPESGYLWSPRAAIVGGTSAVQSVETSPGFTQLLIAPASSGPILFRDTTVNADWKAASSSYQSFPSWDVKGNIVLCQSGEVAEIAHIALKSAAVGARPLVSLLLGEIAASTTTPFDPLQITSTDPPNLPPSQTVYSDRYSALQNGVAPVCDNFQLKVDYGTQNFPDELLSFSIYGAKHAERKQQ